ncbi:formimidoylglutamate deiminase [Nocardioides nitrophenolicus]|uniref:formimidoylglutamate deiminase n=1 Tax=Nocardioides nitrophenolicus TaxID=60489 RepID=UPI00195A822D|nr:formimidoylglutamate deiminase [Nocardioides nitrophenolicus]MBM7518561.1 formiminoglutamate deiminase [Nocardioides nitrophenolicus]
MSAPSRSFHCALALVGGRMVADVRITARAGSIAAIESGVPVAADDLALGVVVPGFANAHSHAFHRALRGRTHADGGDFWQWRTGMYDVAQRLTPDTYHELARSVFGEMRDAGYTAVGEFHYVHHRLDGTPYVAHDMELALASAAVSAGIRLVLLDTCYLRGGVGAALSPEQARFGDGSADRWLDRWHRLRGALPDDPTVTLGAAVHSVRAVSRDDLRVIAEGLPSDVPLHAHVSEQPAENAACLEAHGLTPVGLLAECGLLSSRFSAVHATHLTATDIALLAAADATVVMCPTTEADLGDGIGPAPELAAAGARIAIGSDQHVVIDPLEELSRLELDQRLRLQRRGVFGPDLLWAAGGVRGYESLGLASATGRAPGFRVGDLCDAVELDVRSVRTRGADAWQLPLVARAADVRATVVHGRLTRPR